MSVEALHRQPVILLGASNLTIGWRHLLRALQATVQGPIDLQVALGMGRSYVDTSSFWFRGLPGIVHCGLWNNLPLQDSQPPLVLITDVGNDIVYGHKPQIIVDAVAECVRRIRSRRPDSQIVITGLPIASLESVQRLQFLVARTALFPVCFLSLTEILQNALSIDAGIRQLAGQLQIPYVVPEAGWYGKDPIHVLRHLREPVFRKFFSHWRTRDDGSDPTTPDLANVTRPHLGRAILDDGLHPTTLDLAAFVPLPSSASRTVCWIKRRTAQPVFDLDELRVSAW